MLFLIHFNLSMLIIIASLNCISYTFSIYFMTKLELVISKVLSLVIDAKNFYNLTWCLFGCNVMEM